jgi:DNA-directed RNA polymerase subunit beta
LSWCRAPARRDAELRPLVADGKVIVEAGRASPRATSSQLEQAKISALKCRDDYLLGRILAHDVVDPKSGELLASANDELHDDHLAKLARPACRTSARCGSTTSTAVRTFPNTLRIDPTRTQLEALVEIYRMMRPGEPPTKDAAQNLFQNLFFNRPSATTCRASAA